MCKHCPRYEQMEQELRSYQQQTRQGSFIVYPPRAVCSHRMVIRGAVYGEETIACELEDGHLNPLIPHVGLRVGGGGPWGNGTHPVYWNGGLPISFCALEYAGAVCVREQGHTGSHTEAGGGPRNPYADSDFRWHFANGYMRSSGTPMAKRGKQPRSRAERKGHRRRTGS